MSPEELPTPDAAALQHSDKLQALICAEIAAAGGHIPFDRYMDMALYQPGLGYYAAGLRKFGEAGDFVTAPEVSDLFSRCVARYAAGVLAQLDDGSILEAGPGSGVMAAAVLEELRQLDCLPKQYCLLEVSDDLRERQQALLQERVPDLMDRIVWVQDFPDPFSGVLLANELLDALPVQRFQVTADGVKGEAVYCVDGELQSRFDQPLTADAQAMFERLPALPGDYQSELNLRAPAWVRAMAQRLQQGVLLFADYGGPRSELFHPQRNRGTLMCHYRHRAHDQALLWPGLQDITSHVDFTAVAEAGTEAGLTLAGYTTQAHFLLANGLEHMIMASDPNDARSHLALMQQVKTLTLPGEMGERFKLIGLAKDVDAPLTGALQRDLSNRL